MQMEPQMQQMDQQLMHQIMLGSNGTIKIDMVKIVTTMFRLNKLNSKQEQHQRQLKLILINKALFSQQNNLTVILMQRN